nr:MAG TPA: hypothetical protein [Caudoviricetes sp.]
MIPLLSIKNKLANNRFTLFLPQQAESHCF